MSVARLHLSNRRIGSNTSPGNSAGSTQIQRPSLNFAVTAMLPRLT
jgi:hypothetical protein